MSKDELWDSVKKAAKPSLDRFDKLDKPVSYTHLTLPTILLV